MQHPPAPAASVTTSTAQSKRYSLIGDVYYGAVLGDFSPRLGIPGAVTQAALGYVPVVGSVTALRDAVADWRQHDSFGVILNLLAAFPVLGGLPKTADVIHTLHRLHRVQHYVSHRPQDEEAKQQSNGCLAFLLSIVMLSFGVAYGFGIHLAAYYAQTSWFVGANTSLIGNGPLIVAVALAAFGLSIGEVICIGTRAWFGVIFLPAAMFIGLFLIGGGI